MKIVEIMHGELEASDVQALKTLAETYDKCDDLQCCFCPLNIVSESDCIGSKSLEILRNNKLV